MGFYRVFGWLFEKAIEALLARWPEISIGAGMIALFNALTTVWESYGFAGLLFVGLASTALVGAIRYYWGDLIDRIGVRASRLHDRKMLLPVIVLSAAAALFVVGLVWLAVARYTDKGPIAWELRLPGLITSEGAHYINQFHFKGQHNERYAVRLTKAEMVSRLTGQRIPLKVFVAHEPLLPPHELNPIPAGATIEMSALLYDPAVSHLDNKMGLREDDFRSQWGEANFVYEIDGRTYTVEYSAKFLEERFRHKREPKAPTVTKRKQ